MSDAESFTVVVRQSRGGTVLSVSGVLDAQALPRVSRELTDAQMGQGTVVVDLSMVTFMDSRGLGSLLAANERSREGAAAVCIYRPSDAVRRLLDVAGVRAVLDEVDELPA